MKNIWRRIFRNRARYGKDFVYGVDRNVRIGDLLPPENTGAIQKAIIVLKNKDFARVMVKYIPEEKG